MNTRSQAESAAMSKEEEEEEAKGLSRGEVYFFATDFVHRKKLSDVCEKK